MARLAALVARRSPSARRVADRPAARVGPNYERPQLPTPPQYRFVEATGAGAVAGRPPWCQVFDDPALQALIRDAIANNLDLRWRWRASRRRAPAPASPSRSSTRRSTAAPATACGRRRTRRAGRTTDDDTTHQSGTYGFQLSWEIDLFGRLRRAARSGAGARAGERAGPPRRAGHAGRRRRVELLPAARARPAARDRAADASPQRRDGRPTSRTGSTAACRTGSSSIASRRNRALTAAAIPEIEQQIAIVENALSLLLGRPPGADRARAAGHRRAAAAADSAGPAGLAARAAARRRRRPSSCSSRPTPTSAPPRRCSIRRSA